ncbi:MAG: hypothetical protein ABSG94_12940 [Brevinematales bacterium]|jgi:predicted RNase H-like nuclease (RuvC/YqgF family)
MKIFTALISTVYFILFLGSCSNIKPEDFRRLKTDNAVLIAMNQNLVNDMCLEKDEVETLQKSQDRLKGEVSEYSNENNGLKNFVNFTESSLGKQIEILNKAIKNNNLKISSLQQEISNNDLSINNMQNTFESLTGNDKFL